MKEPKPAVRLNVSASVGGKSNPEQQRNPEGNGIPGIRDGLYVEEYIRTRIYGTEAVETAACEEGIVSPKFWGRSQPPPTALKRATISVRRARSV